MMFKTAKELDRTEGTVELVSANNEKQHLGTSTIVLVPQPSQDVNDPLRWPQYKKHLAFSCILLFTFLNNFTFDGPSAGFQNIAIYFNITINQVSGLLSWLVLALGLSNFFWIPTAAYFGKRPSFLVACSTVFACAIWGAKAKSFNSLLASTVVGGFGGGASEAVGAAMVNDLYFLHERGKMMGIYMLAISWGSSFGPLVGGFLIENLGWQWQKWLSAILVGINLVLIFFFLPETRWNRVEEISPVQSGDERSPNGSVKEPATVETASEAILSNQTYGTRNSFLKELNPWSGLDKNANLLNLFLKPFPLIVYPACTFALLAYSIALAPTVMVNIVSSPILESPPYLFGSGIVGLTNVAGIVGQLGGFLLGGPLTDVYATYRASRNNGIFLPESRLPLLIVPSLIVVAGQLLFGFGVQHTLHWATLYVGYGMISVGLTAIATISMTYVVESYYVVSQDCLELVNGLKNVIAFGFVYATVPWTTHEGYAKTFGELSGVFCAIMLLAVPLFFWGPKIRHYTSTNWRLISVD
ncbi:hypothetical protein BP6252_11231 [Coleophoma cylindrospora]|uniref:Major facilitator superfamily (MFS) profile domain-containing protein n=1 Tax=Coleophoma cylindrospora TaxID=1849047 RepID=A0A3D8QPD0_9HELO|nr:hypothetical protein BP6252_11231 [Coleophoma cylindrospora]